MKLCQTCGQPLAEEITTCPNCGSEVREGRKYIDDYRILEVLHEGHSSILCRAIRSDAETPVMIRLFTPRSGVDEKVADRLKRELEELKQLPEAYFVRHLEIKQSLDGLWYRVSEWVNAENWGALLASGRLQDFRVAFDLFYRIASILEGLHKIGHIIPHLILDDIMVIEGDGGRLDVKIDYKLSRFLDPKMDRPGPMLKKLLDCHPDILNRRPLDIRSDVWSLGKIFVELLSGDLETCDFTAKVDELALPRDVATLIKVMLSKDPDLRPRSMAEVAEILSRVKDKDIEAAEERRMESTPAPAKEVRRLKKRFSFMVAALVALVMAAGLVWYRIGFEKKDPEAVFMDFAGRYAGSVAFVLVEYRLKEGEITIYQNRTEGTAFLVSQDGYLLTNRHVACPWLEDRRLHAIADQFRLAGRSLRFHYSMHLWFEGEKAFKRLPVSSDRSDLNDAYVLNSAFSTGRSPRVSIAGVARPPVKTRQLIRSPLKDDFAVLKIDPVPEGLTPLPLDHDLKAVSVLKLSPVMTLGFPLGSQTQEQTVNVSVTRGHVRRAFENMIQVDTSIYKGNSGGPLIDIRGKVIGIASAVAVDWAAAPVPVVTLLSDIGMVLPITQAAAFLKELKNGRVKWNGVIDLSIDTKIREITALAARKEWARAQARADKELAESLDPSLVMTAGIMHFCSGDYTGAGRLFDQALSMDNQNDQAKFMRFLIDWLAGESARNPYREELLSMDWRSPAEFLGHLVRVLEKHVDAREAIRGGYSENERGWLYYGVGLMTEGQGRRAEAEHLIRKAVLAADGENELFLMALSRLEQIEQRRQTRLKNAGEKTEYQSDIAAFNQRLQQNQTEKAARRAALLPLLTRLKQPAGSPEDKQTILKEILKRQTADGNTLAGLVFYSAMIGSFDEALQHAGRFLKIRGRENADRLRIGLLIPGMLRQSGREAEAKKGFLEFHHRVKDPWYRTLSEFFITDQAESDLIRKAGESPEYLLTAHVALGFWAEGAGDREKAVRHYREALETYMDDWLEYRFARERIKRLRQAAPT